MRDLVIRGMVKGDVKPLAELHVDAWKVAYAPILTQKHLDWVSVQREIRRNRALLRNETPVLVAELGGLAVGFIVYDRDSDEQLEGIAAVEISSFWVDHRSTRQGIGAALLTEMIRRETPTQVCVWVLTGVEAGPAFYEKNGFLADEESRTDFVFLDEPMPMVRYVKRLPRKRTRIKKKK